MKINHVQNQTCLAAPKRSVVLNSIGDFSNNPANRLNASSGVHSVISFGGLKDKSHVLHVLAELPPWMKIGGVATVGKDYMNMADWLDELKATNPDIAAALGDGKTKVSLVIPYYNGDTKNGSVSVRTISGQPVWVNDVNSKKYAYNSAGLASDTGAVTHLREVVSTDMQWGATKSSPVKLFQVIDHPALAGKENVDVYMLFTEGTARMPRAYANGAYCSELPTSTLTNKTTVADSLRSMSPDVKIKALTRAYTSQQPYHQFSKGVVEAIEKAGINAETIICSDSQTMLIPEFIAQKFEAGDEFFKGAKTTGVFHNTGAVYCGECSAKDIFLAMASPEQIEKVRKSPEYIFAKEIGKEEDYFKRFVQGYQDGAGNTNPNMAILQHVKNGHGYVNTVSQVYAQSMAADSAVTPLQPLWKELYNEGRVGGIINGFEDPGVSGLKKLGLGGYTKRIFANSVGADGAARSISLQPYVSYSIDDMKLAANPPFRPFEVPKDAPFENIKAQISDLFKQGELGKVLFHLEGEGGSEETKVIDFFTQNELDKIAGRKILGVEIQDRTLLRVSDAEKALIQNATEPTIETVKIARKHNKVSFLKRFTDEFREAFGEKETKLAETGLPGRHCSVMGSIDSKYIADIDAGKDIPLFVSWGRGDFQKGHPIALESFIKFAKSKEGENALLVMGGELPKGANETRRILELMEMVNADSSLKGRIAFIDGFAPGYAMSSAADFAVFASRFEPCGLTPPEAQKYFCTPMVLNTQGLAQQIFDPRTATEGEMINGYKTVNEFYMPKDKINSIIEIFAKKTKTLDDAAKIQLRADFPYSCDDLSLFEQFAEEYQKLLVVAKDKVYGTVPQMEVDNQAIIELQRMPEYGDLINRLKEGILRDELAASMKQGVVDAADPVKAEEMFKNHLNLNTSWMGNARLNGIDTQTGKELSSAELYCRRHILPDASATLPKTIFRFSDDLVDAKLDLGDFHVPNGEIKVTAGVGGGIDPKTFEQLNAGLRTIADKIDETGMDIRSIGGKVDNVSNVIKNMPNPPSAKDIAEAVSSNTSDFGKGLLSNLGNIVTDKRVLAGLGTLAAVGTLVALATSKVKTENDTVTPKMPQNSTKPLNTTQAVVAPIQPSSASQNAVQSVVLTPDNKFANHFQKMA